MMLPPWNKILRALPPFVVIRSNHDGGSGRSLDQVSLLFRWQKQDGEKHERRLCSILPTGMVAAIHWAVALLLVESSMAHEGHLPVQSSV
ncbi:hypothetical protein HU200_021042 [Digitaria exilis]|uniref:Uncharacterized protein n=1 Tax=Digitaria exilis TaxID=1010633 RepID=A0A835EZQ5_9POAL|nr:hypothetical protein HU200_021042 [Digitaria exilis]